MLPDSKNARALVDWLDAQPLDMADDLAAVRRIIESNERLYLLARHAVARVKIANTEGNPILSAWLPEAESAVAKAEGRANGLL